MTSAGLQAFDIWPLMRGSVHDDYDIAHELPPSLKYWSPFDDIQDNTSTSSSSAGAKRGGQTRNDPVSTGGSDNQPHPAAPPSGGYPQKIADTNEASEELCCGPFLYDWHSGCITLPKRKPPFLVQKKFPNLFWNSCSSDPRKIAPFAGERLLTRKLHAFLNGAS